MINSTSDKQVKRVASLRSKAKVRREKGIYMVKGLRMCRELNPEDVDILYVAENFTGNRDGRKQVEWFRPETVSDAAMNVMVGVRTPQGVLTAVRQKRCTVDNIVRPTSDIKPLAIMILETIQSLRDFETIIRAGEGASVTGIVVNHTTADLYNPKIIRSTMESMYKMPLVYVASLWDACLFMKEKSVRLFAAHLEGMNSYDQEDYTDNVGFLIGSEANGLMEEAALLTGCLVKTPVEEEVESLNATAAAFTLIFETARWRRGYRQ